MAAQVPPTSSGSSSSSSSGGSPPGSTTDSYDGPKIQFDTDSFGPPEILPEELTYIEKIGGGCFGSVFKGECRGKEVAIKKLFRQDLSDKALNDFKKEVEICSRLHHPNVLLFMGACTVPGHMAIVMELMPQGNFEKLLHDPSRQLSLYRRLSMAKQTAQGMNWLHLSKPTIIHRDLKPSNLLVDKWNNVKVCDFGLSAVKPLGEKLKDKDSIPGTPLWMAPEVMMGRPLDEKSDVYSFGVVLWEIATQKAPFPEMTSFPVFKRAICIQNVRPPVPDDMLPSLRTLLELCWHKNPTTRPSFTEVIRMLDIILVDAAIIDEAGRHLWKTNFIGEEKILWKNFAPPFYAAIRQPMPDADNLQLRCLKALVAEESQDATLKDKPFLVDVEHFGRFLSFFGPMEPSDTVCILETVHDVVQCPWFFGGLDKDKAEEKLRDATKGVFLVRLSTTVAGSFTISKVSKKRKINHQRIDYAPGKGYSIRIVKKEQPVIVTQPTLPKLLATLKVDLYLQEACPGSPYLSMFAAAKTGGSEGYLLEDSD